MVKIINPPQTHKEQYLSSSKHPNEIFWYLDDKDQIKIRRIDFLEFLQHHGFFRIQHLRKYHLARISDNIVEVVDKIQIRDYVLDHVRAYSDHLPLHKDVEPRRLLETLMRGSAIFFGNHLLSFLQKDLLEEQRNEKNSNTL